jgi:hypothetical protein
VGADLDRLLTRVLKKVIGELFKGALAPAEQYA